jgi:hypothetical protein
MKTKYRHGGPADEQHGRLRGNARSLEAGPGLLSGAGLLRHRPRLLRLRRKRV